MYLLFKNVSQRDQGIVQTVGKWSNFTVGYLPETHKDIFDYRVLNPRVIPENVASGWMFVDAYKDYISVRTNTPQNEALQVLTSEEAEGTKVKYTLTADEKANAVAIMKEMMRLILDEVYDKRVLELNIGVSALEYSSWEQQRVEAEDWTADNTAPTPLLSSLASARGITLAEMVQKVLDAVSDYNTKVAVLLASKQGVEAEIKACASIADCHRLLHNRFEISMSAAQMADEAVTTSATFNL